MESDGQKVKLDRESLKRSSALSFPLLTKLEPRILQDMQDILTILWQLGVEFEDDESTDSDSEYNEIDDSEEKGWWEEDESEDLDCERNIEEHEYTTFSDMARMVKIWLFLTDEEDEEMDESRWMTNFVAQCTCNSVVITTALAWYIH